MTNTLVRDVYLRFLPSSVPHADIAQGLADFRKLLKSFHRIQKGPVHMIGNPTKIILGKVKENSASH